jgi:hypothetical protein
MDYLKPKMSVDLGKAKITDEAWEMTFGKKCPSCKHKKDDGPFCPDPFHLDTEQK